MRVLLVNNTIFYEENGHLFLNKETGAFFTKLKRFGNKVSSFQISQLKTDKDGFANFNLSDKGINIYEVKRRGNRFLPFLKSFFKVQQAIFQNDFVYIFYPGPICQVIALLCMLYRKPYGLYIRGEQGIETKVSKLIVKWAKIIFTISPKFTDKILQYNSNVQTIRPMIGFSESDIIKEREIDFNKTVHLLYVGRLVYDKGLFELIDVLKILKEKDYNIHLNLVGGGTDYDELIAKVNRDNLNDIATFFGMVSDKNELINIYRNSDIFVLPTYHEGFPRVLYEAMMMRMPIITTFVGTIGYLMKDQYNCLEIAPMDINSIVVQVERLINDPDLARKISINGTNTIMRYLNDKKVDHAEQLNYFLQNNAL